VDCSAATQGGTATLAVAARRRERAENFPVAMRLLPAAPRRHLHAVYAVARLIDDTGDDPTRPAEERAAALDALAGDLDAVWAGRPTSDPVVRALAPTVAECGLGQEPFRALVEANRVDPTTRRYPRWQALRDYCRLSADPVGHIVLAIAGQSTPRTRSLSDDVCTALQVLEHCQDVVEDKRDRDRIYLPLEDLVSYGVTDTDLDGAVATPAVRALVRHEVDRAAALLAAGRPLVAALRGWARFAVAGYVAGGRATVDAFRRAEYDVVSRKPAPRGLDVVRHMVVLLARRR
jgi:squalene synthase HpnC